MGQHEECNMVNTFLPYESDERAMNESRTQAQRAVLQNEERYGKEAREKYGDATVDAANEKIAAMDNEAWKQKELLEAAIIEQLIAAMKTADIKSEEAHKLASMHAEWIAMHWESGAYSIQAHKNLVQMYVCDNRFREYYDSKAGTGACEFLAQAVGACL